jgi:hypothetical protein
MRTDPICSNIGDAERCIVDPLSLLESLRGGQ